MDSSGSLYSPEECDIEPDESEGLYDNNNSCSNRDENECDDDDSIKECYSDFNRRDSVTFTSRDIHNETEGLCVDVENLICPGDVVEFRDVMVNSATKRDSIVTIENSKICTYIVLKSGDILHPTKHAIRKVKVY